MPTLGSPHLTAGYDDAELVRQIKQTRPGRAHFAATGPFGASCKDCVFFGYSRVFRNKAGDVVKTMFQRNRCGKFLALTGRHGNPIPPGTEGCKYFERR